LTVIIENRHSLEDILTFIFSIQFPKREVIYGLVDKVLFLSHPKFQEKILKKAIELLLDNCFPLSFIFCTINKKIKQIAYSNNKFNKDDKEQKQVVEKEYFTIPYVNSTSESFTPVCARFGFYMSHSILNILQKYIKRGKDKLEIRYQQDVVYKIICKDCETTYIGQTKRQLGTRLQEHVKDINKKSGTFR